jgi:hypothetical protein
MRKYFGITYLLPLAILMLTASAIASPILQNGSFENLNNTWYDNSGVGEMKLSPLSTVIPGWTVVNGELAWAPAGFGLYPSNAAFFLDLTGFDDGLPYGGVATSFETTPGESYSVSFDLGSSAYFNGARYVSGPVSVRVDVGTTLGSGSIFSGIFTGNEPLVMNQWDSQYFGFTASGTTTFLQFTGIGQNGTSYIGLDNVSLSQPEPGSILLLGGGLGLLGLAAKRKKA